MKVVRIVHARAGVAVALIITGHWLTVSSLPADTVTLSPVADTTLQEAFPDYNFGDGTSFQAGGRRYGGRARGLLRFDASNIPAGATINAVTLQLTVIETPSGGVNSVFDVHRVEASWGEGSGSDHRGTPGVAGEATWNNRLGLGSPWLIPGGDFAPRASASLAIAADGAYTFNSTTSFVSDVQRWVDNPESNFGWILRSESEGAPTTIRRFGSRDNLLSPPLLAIDFTPPGPRLTLIRIGSSGSAGQALAWPTNFTGFVVQCATNLPAVDSDWQRVSTQRSVRTQPTGLSEAIPSMRPAQTVVEALQG